MTDAGNQDKYGGAEQAHGLGGFRKKRQVNKNLHDILVANIQETLEARKRDNEEKQRAAALSLSLKK